MNNLERPAGRDSFAEIPVLLQRVARGEAAAENLLWEQLMSSMHRVVLTTCHKNRIDVNEAEDLVQNCVLYLSRVSRERLLNVKSWKNVLRWLAKKKAQDYLREQGKRQGWSGSKNKEGIDSSGRSSASLPRPHEVSADAPLRVNGEEVGTLLDIMADTKPGPESLTVDRQLLDKINEYLEKFSKENREIFRLYLQGRMLYEIAAETGLPQTKVNSCIYRIKAAIQEKFMDSYRRLSA